MIRLTEGKYLSCHAECVSNTSSHFDPINNLVKRVQKLSVLQLVLLLHYVLSFIQQLGGSCQKEGDNNLDFKAKTQKLWINIRRFASCLLAVSCATFHLNGFLVSFDSALMCPCALKQTNNEYEVIFNRYAIINK